MSIPKANSRSYILRYWKGEGRTTWRARLEPIGGHGEHKYFATPESLLEFLRESEPQRPNSQQKERSKS